VIGGCVMLVDDKQVAFRARHLAVRFGGFGKIPLFAVVGELAVFHRFRAASLLPPGAILRNPDEVDIMMYVVSQCIPMNRLARNWWLTLIKVNRLIMI